MAESSGKMEILTMWCAALLALCLAGGCEQRREGRGQPQEARPATRQEQFTGLIVAMGDSLTAGLGVDENQAYPALLAAKLRAAGLNYRVINGGISGETSRGALERTPWVLSFGPDIVILATGANDGLRGLDPAATGENLDAIVAALRAKEVEVVLCGMRMVRNLGEEYNAAFEGVYPEVARRHGVIFMPFFLEGVGGEAALNQPDGIHPNAAGYRRVTENLLPYVRQAIAAVENRGPKPASPVPEP